MVSHVRNRWTRREKRPKEVGSCGWRRAGAGIQWEFEDPEMEHQMLGHILRWYFRHVRTSNLGSWNGHWSIDIHNNWRWGQFLKQLWVPPMSDARYIHNARVKSVSSSSNFGFSASHMICDVFISGLLCSSFVYREWPGENALLPLTALTMWVCKWPHARYHHTYTYNRRRTEVPAFCLRYQGNQGIRERSAQDWIFGASLTVSWPFSNHYHLVI